MAVKELILVGGANGSGKTTFIRKYQQLYPYPYLGADEIAAQLAPHDVASAQVQAGREFLLRMDEHLARNESFIVESTLSGRTLARSLQRARINGFSITLMFLYCFSTWMTPRHLFGGYESECAKEATTFPTPMSAVDSSGAASTSGNCIEVLPIFGVLFIMDRVSSTMSQWEPEPMSLPSTEPDSRDSSPQSNGKISAEAFRRMAELTQIGREAVREAQEESRRLGVPNVYCINGVIHYELPNGELTTEDPYPAAQAAKQQPET